MDDLKTIVLIDPLDAHAHYREGDMARFVAPFTVSQFAVSLPMPNTKEQEPHGIVATADQADAYRAFLASCLPEGSDHFFLMPIYLTSKTDPEDVRSGFLRGSIQAAKYYPLGATTNADKGVLNIEDVYPVFKVMQEIGMPLLIHGEMPAAADADPFKSEAKFIKKHLIPLLEAFPRLKVSFEHITTKQAVRLVMSNMYPNLTATVTPQHLLFNRRELYRGGNRPHMFCWPILKARKHMLAIQRAILSGHPGFRLGTDSAPHPKGDKLKDCGCAGCFSAPIAPPLYIQFFVENNARRLLQPFASDRSAKFFGIERKLRNKPFVFEYVECGYDPPSSEELNGLTTMTAVNKLYWRLVA